ncbi:hypothetical protein HDU67_000558 [Dinochytrium kinnereticum]|nr:hypothetical protein HDU67_000558 [Dinochytrium kinnereticum]
MIKTSLKHLCRSSRLTATTPSHPSIRLHRSNPLPSPFLSIFRTSTTTPISSGDAPPPKAQRPSHLQRKKPDGGEAGTRPSPRNFGGKKEKAAMDGRKTGLTITEVVESFSKLNPRVRLWLSLGLMAFSLVGIYGTYKLEESFPTPKAPTVPLPKNSPDGPDAVFVPRSKLDEILMKEVQDNDE